MKLSRRHSVSVQSFLRVALLFTTALLPPRMEAQVRDSVPDILPGTRVRVLLIRQAVAVEGVVAVQNADTLYVSQRCEACRARAIAWADIAAIDRSLGRALDPRRAMAGAVGGGGIGALFGAAILGSANSEHTGGGAIITIGGAMLGAVIGGVVGLGRGGEEWERFWPAAPRH